MIRPANLLTALADVLAGMAIAGYFSNIYWHPLAIVVMAVSTMGLYSGGIVFNDIFDRKIDSIERPERAIPSGALSLVSALVLGSILLFGGVISAFLANPSSGMIALLIACLALLYNRFSKHHTFLGPLNMGACRGLNLLLGISIIPAVLNDLAFLGIVPMIYIFSITLISQGEVHGGSKNKLLIAAILFAVVIGLILGFSYTSSAAFYTIPFLLLFGIMIYRPLFKAIHDPTGKNIGKAVKAGVISLILMNAAWAAAFGEIWVALGIALLLPFSLFLARQFAVT